MISISTNTFEFWNNKEENSALFIYGAGIISECIVELVKQANIKIDGFIDRDTNKHSHTFNGYKIYSPEELKSVYKNKNIKIFVAINDTWGAMYYLEKNFDNVKVYLQPIENDGCSDKSSINFALAPLRNLCLKRKDFTLVANTCAGSRIYQMLNCEYESPFVAVIIKPDEYLKLCQNLKQYLSYPLEFIRYEEWMLTNKYHTLCKLGDIEIKFIGRQDFEKCKQDWINRVKRVNYDNLFFIYENTHYRPSIDFYDKFLEIPLGTKLILQRDVHLNCKHSISTVDYANLFNPTLIIEKWFRLTDFLNHDIEY